MKRLWIGMVACLAAAGVAQNASAQGLSVSLRGGGAFPLGSFSETDDTDNVALAAKNGFGYGLDVGFAFSQSLGLYAGFDQLRFQCDDGTDACGNGGDYTLTGFTAGVKLSPFQSGTISPWIKGGITFDALEADFEQGDFSGLSADRAPGFEVGAGLDIPLGGVIRLTPQVRYGGQTAKLNGIIEAPDTEEEIRYFTASLGLGFGFPFGGMR